VRTHLPWRLPTLCLLTALATAPAGCRKKSTIPGTQIPDTDVNRAVVEAIERYRVALVARDAATILTTAHRTYYDGAGTDDPGDDITYQELGPVIRDRVAQVQSVRFTIDYLEVSVNEDRAVVKAWIDAAFRLGVPDGSDWDPRVEARYTRLQDYAMFELVREGKSWLITSGL
jgi:hypothetical protein